MRQGSVVKISGPTVVARGLEEASLYEETNGLGRGEPVVASGEPLTVELGPGLLGQVFDGIERPLSVLAHLSGDFIQRGISHAALDREKRWEFEPLVRVWDELREGQILGAVQETGSLTHRILAPPGVSGKVAEVRHS